MLRKLIGSGLSTGLCLLINCFPKPRNWLNGSAGMRPLPYRLPKRQFTGGWIFPFLRDCGWSNSWQSLFVNPKMQRKVRGPFSRKGLHCSKENKTSRRYLKFWLHRSSVR